MNKVIRLAYAAAALMLLTNTSAAQDNQFNVGSKVFHVGLVGGDEEGGGFGIGGGFEVGIKDIANGIVRLGVGGSISLLRDTYHSFCSSSGACYKSTLTTTPVLFFVHGHYQLSMVPKLDLLAGPAIGFTRTHDKDEGAYCLTRTSCDDDSSIDPAIGIQAGARYELNSKIAGSLLLSAGNNVPWANIGVAFKF